MIRTKDIIEKGNLIELCYEGENAAGENVKVFIQEYNNNLYRIEVVGSKTYRKNI